MGKNIKYFMILYKTNYMNIYYPYNIKYAFFAREKEIFSFSCYKCWYFANEVFVEKKNF